MGEKGEQCIMCKFCDELNILKNNFVGYKYGCQIYATSYYTKAGVTSQPFDLNWCPVCGKGIKKDLKKGTANKVTHVIIGETVIPAGNIISANASNGEVEIEYRDDIEKGVVRTVKLNAPYDSTGVIVYDTGEE